MREINLYKARTALRPRGAPASRLTHTPAHTQASDVTHYGQRVNVEMKTLWDACVSVSVRFGRPALLPAMSAMVRAELRLREARRGRAGLQRRE